MTEEIRMETYVVMACGPRAPQLRWGQHAFNVLHEWRPDLADKIRSTDVDPFYDDEVMPRFLHAVALWWN